VRTVIGGDAILPSISAASIIAKTHRDALMVRMCERYPGYGLSRHFGYCTAQHVQALVTLGPCPIHRRSFNPLRSWLSNALPVGTLPEGVLVGEPRR
jgi:ribonuclease HII